MEYYRRRQTYQAPAPKKRRLPIWLLLTMLFIILAAGGISAWTWLRKTPNPHSAPQAAQAQQPEPNDEPVKPPLVNLQPITDAWLAKQNKNNEYSFVVYDPANDAVIAQHGGDTQYFTASIYKLYVAYLAYQDLESGVFQATDPLIGGRNIQECLHEMIYSSDSPCAETMLAEIGQPQTTERLKAFGLTGTAFPAFVTTANDAVAILKRLHNRQDLDDSSITTLLASMKDQVYREGFQTGAAGATVYDKIGFYETGWHDVGIMELPNGRTYIYAFLSKGSGSKPVADFAKTITNELAK